MPGDMLKSLRYCSLIHRKYSVSVLPVLPSLFKFRNSSKTLRSAFCGFFFLMSVCCKWLTAMAHCPCPMAHCQHFRQLMHAGRPSRCMHGGQLRIPDFMRCNRNENCPSVQQKEKNMKKDSLLFLVWSVFPAFLVLSVSF